MFKVQTYSVRDSEPRGFLTDEYELGGRTSMFTSLDDVRRRVPRLLRGSSAIWQVRAVRADDPEETTVLYGFRAGPGGTGNRWDWRECTPATTSDADVLREIGMDAEADDLDRELGGNF